MPSITFSAAGACNPSCCDILTACQSARIRRTLHLSIDTSCDDYVAGFPIDQTLTWDGSAWSGGGYSFYPDGDCCWKLSGFGALTCHVVVQCFDVEVADPFFATATKHQTWINANCELFTVPAECPDLTLYFTVSE